MIHIWNFEELSKIVGLKVILDGWCLRVTFTHEDWEEFIEFSSQQTYDSYVDALYRHNSRRVVKCLDVMSAVR